MGWLPKVNRHIDIRLPNGKVRPGTITAVYGNDLVDARVGHHGETYTMLARTPDRSTWQPTPMTNDPDLVAFWRARDYKGGTHLPNLARADGLHDLRLGSTLEADTNDPTFLPYDGEKYVYIPGPGSNQNYVRSGAVTCLSGSIDVRVHLAPMTGASDVIEILASQYVGENREWRLSKTATGGLYFEVYVDDVSLGSAHSGASSSIFIPGQLRWFRGTFNGSTGNMAVWVSDDGATWTQLASVNRQINVSPIGGITDLTLGAYSGGATGLNGSFYYAEIRDGIDGPIVASWKASDMDQQGGESGGRQWAINRSATGRKAVLVDRPLFLFGTDDYMEAPDHPELNFGDGQDFTIVAAGRDFGNQNGNNAVFAKKQSIGGSNVYGYVLVRNSAARTFRSVLQPLGSTSSLNRSAPLDGQTWQVYQRVSQGVHALGSNGDVVTDVMDNPDGIANSLPFRIGALSGATLNAIDMEFFGAAIFRRALSDAEIAEVGRVLGASQ